MKPRNLGPTFLPYLLIVFPLLFAGGSRPARAAVVLVVRGLLRDAGRLQRLHAPLLPPRLPQLRPQLLHLLRE